ncbi:MAG: acetyl-CoA carboxylase biotin carboxyl carrier protein [Lachnospiraceae bacterium]|nr:acetyl-CoA carboxylase biotin carboxyl carrier protein [Lachnospiraceae bacterium]MDD7027911.1 acetyl-CoA carboxylase biotin carboxyl carrier protein [Lachnospiraceae bacterium]MDY5700708.1 acetyl-CoA carboxylase biotin carboxyl carrier protein [Lachnospiraceae bacterium]
MDIQEIYALMDRFERSSLSRMKLETGEVKLTLDKGFTASEKKAGSFAGAVNSGESSQPVAKQQETGGELIEIKAPFVGTFYQAASPEDKPFVTAGQSVKKGEIIGIIEAMKLMNEIAAPQDGVVAELLVEDGALVEYNQVLMTLK